ncbi:MAG: hypothetical protein WBF53_00925 [Litorimonas sp.]
MTDDAKTECRTPSEDKSGSTRIPSWKYDLISAAISEAVIAAGPDGLAFSDLTEAVRERLEAVDLDRLGSLGWHVTTVKLEMEVRGDLARLPETLQRLIVPGMGS